MQRVLESLLAQNLTVFICTCINFVLKIHVHRTVWVQALNNVHQHTVDSQCARYGPTMPVYMYICGLPLKNETTRQCISILSWLGSLFIAGLQTVSDLLVPIYSGTHLGNEMGRVKCLAQQRPQHGIRAQSRTTQSVDSAVAHHIQPSCISSSCLPVTIIS